MSSRAACPARSWGGAGKGGKRAARRFWGLPESAKHFLGQRTVQIGTDKRRARGILLPTTPGGGGVGLCPAGAVASQGRE
jgi:hypothetical protein